MDKPNTMFDVIRALRYLAEEVKQLLMKYGAEKLSGIAESEYAALLKEAENLGS